MSDRTDEAIKPMLYAMWLREIRDKISDAPVHDYPGHVPAKIIVVNADDAGMILQALDEVIE